MLNRFANINQAHLGEARALFEFYAAITGLTSTGKDVFSSIITQNPQLAISSRPDTMETAANVFMSVIGGQAKESYEVNYQGSTRDFTDAGAYQQHMKNLMETIRNGG